MEKFKPALSDNGKESVFLSKKGKSAPVTEAERFLEQELAKKKKEIESLQRIYNTTSIELMETNNAIAVLAKKYQKISQDKELEIAGLIEQKILPSILSLKESINNHEAHELELEILVCQVKAMVRELTYGPDSFNQLTPAEMRVAVLIRHGTTSQQIADRLFISESTVKTHRKNIRNKLNLQNKKLNLIEYLSKIM